MGRPEGLETKIFLDSGDPRATERVIAALGFLDGQTTNPTLMAQQARAEGKIFTRASFLDFYREKAREISGQIPEGSVSLEVYADESSTARDLLDQIEDMYPWIPNSHMKLPITRAGLEAAFSAARAGVRVNMTLCFSQIQAVAVHYATEGAQNGQVFISPFVGRLDDEGQNGMDLVRNIVRAYRDLNSPVEVLTASTRSVNHIKAAIKQHSESLTAPEGVLVDWANQGFPHSLDFVYQPNRPLNPVLIQRVARDGRDSNWRSKDISHYKTTEGLRRFASDWNSCIAASVT